MSDDLYQPLMLCHYFCSGLHCGPHSPPLHLSRGLCSVLWPQILFPAWCGLDNQKRQMWWCARFEPRPGEALCVSFAPLNLCPHHGNDVPACACQFSEEGKRQEKQTEPPRQVQLGLATPLWMFILKWTQPRPAKISQDQPAPRLITYAWAQIWPENLPTETSLDPWSLVLMGL